MENKLEMVKSGSVYMNGEKDYIDLCVHRVTHVKIGKWHKLDPKHPKSLTRTIDIETGKGSWFTINLFREG